MSREISNKRRALKKGKESEIIIRFVDQGIIDNCFAYIEIYAGSAMLKRVAAECVNQGCEVGFKDNFAIPGATMPFKIEFSRKDT
jgi:hypothetical protein